MMVVPTQRTIDSGGLELRRFRGRWKLTSIPMGFEGARHVARELGDCQRYGTNFTDSETSQKMLTIIPAALVIT